MVCRERLPGRPRPAAQGLSWPAHLPGLARRAGPLDVTDTHRRKNGRRHEQGLVHHRFVPRPGPQFRRGRPVSRRQGCRDLRDQGSGHIIQISSVGGLTVFPLGGGYVASKWALQGLSETLAQEVADFGIKVTLVEPGSYATEGAAGGVHADANPLYDGLRESFADFAKTLNVGDPAAAGRALLKVADSGNPPLRVFFGAQGNQIVPQVYADRLNTWADWQDLAEEAHGHTRMAPAT
ncbi:SDR family NAD(P)-dependent oxidoreductase [Nonomuraea mesophila]|uniref:SDR family NAD(P)-dependent oxidoreductase n=1 Tax=Nonomuraea mesophila TaxID=2530382 RepID=UPI001FE58043|nr:SDR family NAD(P)-dependent oxidoreductase [Nonomuraea mesophila]